MGRQALTVPLLIALAILACGSLVYGVKTARVDSADLHRRAEEVQRFLHRQDPYEDEGHDNTYPPPALPVFAATVPLGPAPVRIWVWIVLNLLALAAIGAVVVRTWGASWPPWVRAAFVLTAIASKPVRAGIALGQFHLIPTALILGAESLGAAGRPVASGLLTGLALTKPTIAAPYMLLLAARRQWQAFTVALALQTFLFGFASTWLGIGPATLTREWLRNARSQLAMGTIDVPSVLVRLMGSSAPDASAASLVALLATAAALVSLRRRSSLGLVALACFAAAVMTYHRHYDMVLLLPALAYLIDAALGARRPGAGWIAALFGFLLIIPSHRAISGRWEAAYDLGFVVASYLTLAAVFVLIATEPTGSENDPGPRQ